MYCSTTGQKLFARVITNAARLTGAVQSTPVQLVRFVESWGRGETTDTLEPWASTVQDAADEGSKHLGWLVRQLVMTLLWALKPKNTLDHAMAAVVDMSVRTAPGELRSIGNLHLPAAELQAMLRQSANAFAEELEATGEIPDEFAPPPGPEEEYYSKEQRPLFRLVAETFSDEEITRLYQDCTS